MLPPFIIEQIRRREEERIRRRDEQQPTLDLPNVHPPRRGDDADDDESEERDRGVVIIDLG